MSGVILHPKHGVNPTIPTCFYCGGEMDEIVMLGNKSKAVTGQDRAPKHGPVMSMRPCPDCREIMKAGIILISIKDEDVGDDNPYRTGGWVAVKDEALRRFVQPPELMEQMARNRFCFVPDKAWDKMGLPRGETAGVPTTMEEFRAKQGG